MLWIGNVVKDRVSYVHEHNWKRAQQRAASPHQEQELMWAWAVAAKVEKDWRGKKLKSMLTLIKKVIQKQPPVIWILQSQKLSANQQIGLCWSETEPSRNTAYSFKKTKLS